MYKSAYKLEERTGIWITLISLEKMKISVCLSDLNWKIKFEHNRKKLSVVNGCRHLIVATILRLVPGLLIAGAKDCEDNELQEQQAACDIENCVPGFKSRLEINQSLVRFHVRIIPKQI